MSFFKSINNAFVKCLDFSSRASRSEFWYFYLFTVIMNFFSMNIDKIIGYEIINLDEMIIIGPIYLFLSFLFFIPQLSLYVRRLHDINLSGWLLLIIFIPFIGLITIIYFMCLKGNERNNDFGEISS